MEWMISIVRSTWYSCANAGWHLTAVSTRGIEAVDGNCMYRTRGTRQPDGSKKCPGLCMLDLDSQLGRCINKVNEDISYSYLVRPPSHITCTILDAAAAKTLGPICPGRRCAFTNTGQY